MADRDKLEREASWPEAAAISQAAMRIARSAPRLVWYESCHERVGINCRTYRKHALLLMQGWTVVSIGITDG